VATTGPPRTKTLWRRFRRATRGPRNALLARGILLVARAVGALPVPVALALGRGLGAGAYACLGRARRLALAHVAIAFPDLDEPARRALVRATFRHAGMAYAELAAWRRLAADPDYVRIERKDLLDDALRAGRGCLVVTGHCGNWELLASRIASLGVPLTVVARRVNDERFDALIRGYRGGAGMEILLRDDPRFLAAVRDALGRNRVVALLIDQDSAGGGVFVPFFGRLAHTPPGAAILAFRTKAPVLASFIRRRPDGGHLITFETMPVPPSAGAGKVTELTATFTAAIEAAIRRAPAEWVWWHERWRRRPE
jgi:KDO2-lipid IV(A) lauroyltransferase